MHDFTVSILLRIPCYKLSIDVFCMYSTFTGIDTALIIMNNTFSAIIKEWWKSPTIHSQYLKLLFYKCIQLSKRQKVHVLELTSTQPTICLIDVAEYRFDSHFSNFDTPPRPPLLTLCSVSSSSCLKASNSSRSPSDSLSAVGCLYVQQLIFTYKKLHN